jgi:hypothetical protein
VAGREVPRRASEQRGAEVVTTEGQQPRARVCRDGCWLRPRPGVAVHGRLGWD